MRPLFALLLGLLAFWSAASGAAAGDVVRLEPRPGVVLPIFALPRAGASHTVVLLSGGKGGFGRIEDGRPSSGNFLVRSHDLFASAGFNVIVVGRSKDSDDWDGHVRTSAEHVRDLAAVVEYARKTWPVPVWMIGTSMGTISTTAAAIGFGNDALAGIVLTSSVLGYKWPGAVPRQALDRIRIPVLVYHHAADACKACAPHEAPNVIAGLVNAPVKKLILAEGGSEPQGDPCEAFHRHGFIGMEGQAVEAIAAWIRAPRS